MTRYDLWKETNPLDSSLVAEPVEVEYEPLEMQRCKSCHWPIRDSVDEVWRRLGVCGLACFADDCFENGELGLFGVEE